VSVCDVEVKNVSVGCGSGNCVEWTGQLVNKVTEPVEIDWVAEMQVDVAGAAPLTYRDAGTVLVRPGEELISGSFCESRPAQARKVRVTVWTDTGAANCDTRKQDSIDPCEKDEREDPKATKEPEPTKEVEPTEEPEPTKEPQPTTQVRPTRQPEPTRQPQPQPTEEPTEEPTKQPEPTSVPRLTEIALPTIPLLPTKTPKPDK
jgi:hypothetical protein